MNRMMSQYIGVQQRTGLTTRSTINRNQKIAIEVNARHPMVMDPQVMGMEQQRLDMWGNWDKMEGAAQPKYKNVSNPEAINAQIQMVLQQPQNIDMIKQLVAEQNERVARKLPRNQRQMINSGRQVAQNAPSNMMPIMPNVPMGLPIAQGYQLTDDDQALLQMQDPNPSVHFAETGGRSTLMMATPPASYIQDPVSGQKARQGGMSYNRQMPTGPGGPEVQIHHEAVAPLPQKNYFPNVNIVNQGPNRTSLNRIGM